MYGFDEITKDDALRELESVMDRDNTYSREGIEKNVETILSYQRAIADALVVLLRDKENTDGSN